MGRDDEAPEQWGTRAGAALPLAPTGVPRERKRERHSEYIQGFVYAGAISMTLLGIVTALHIRFSVPYQVLGLLAASFSFLLFRRFDLTAPWRIGRPGSIGTRVLYTWLGLVGALLFVAYVAKYSAYFSRLALLLWLVMTPVVLFGTHWVAHRLARHVLPQVAERRSAVIVFANESALAFAQNLRASNRYELVGFFDDRDAGRLGEEAESITRIGSVEHVAAYVREHGVEVVFVMLPDAGVKRAVRVLTELGDTTASVYFVPDLYVSQLLGAEFTEIEGVPALRVAETPFYGADGLFKQMTDVIGGLAGIVILAPLLALIAIAIKLDTPGPVIFQQRRYGLNGRSFWVYKFRSMTVADRDTELEQVGRADSRVTRVGRFLRRTSMDELPQLWNVIRGEMSLVGPRPHSIAHNEYYRKEIKRYMVRHKVKPGLTGWAQVHGLRGETLDTTRMEDRIRFDLEYIRNWSPWLDVKIVLMTLLIVLRDRNAY